MSLEIVHLSSPDLPVSIPILDGLSNEDKLRISVELKPKSCLEVTLKASDEEKIDSRIPLSLSISLEDGVICKSGKNKKWEIEPAKEVPIETGIVLLTIAVEDEKYRIEVDGNLYCDFVHKYPPFITEIIEIKVTEGETVVKSVSFLREMKWLGGSIGSAIPETAFKCGKDEIENDIYLGRGMKNNSLSVVSVNPKKNEAKIAYGNREWPINYFELLHDNGYYGWKLVKVDEKIPENVVECGYNEYGEKNYIGRATYDGSVIPGTLNKETGILSIPFKGKELKLTSRFEVLIVTNPPEEAKSKKKPETKDEKNPAVKQPKNPDECVICLNENVTTAFDPCFHLNFCETCANEHIKKSKLCPICRKTITRPQRIYR